MSPSSHSGFGSAITNCMTEYDLLPVGGSPILVAITKFAPERPLEGAAMAWRSASCCTSRPRSRLDIGSAAIKARKLLEVGLSIALRVDSTAHDLHSARKEQRLEPILGTHHVGHELGIHIGCSELARLSCVFLYAELTAPRRRLSAR